MQIDLQACVPRLVLGSGNGTSLAIAGISACEGEWRGWHVGCERRTRPRMMPAALTPTPKIMLHWTLVFLVIAIVAAVFGFSSLAGTAAMIAKVLFVVFLILWIISFFFRRGGA